MDKRIAIAFASLLFVSTVAVAQFSGSMTASQLETAVKAQVQQGKTPGDIAKAALAANVGAGQLTTALIASGVNPATAVSAVVAAGGDVTSVVVAAINAGVAPSVAANAALAAGANPAVVQAAVNSTVPGRGFALAGSTPGTTTPGGSGGGSASIR